MFENKEDCNCECELDDAHFIVQYDASRAI